MSDEIDPIVSDDKDLNYSQPLVSIILTVYHRLEYLPGAIDSARAQTFKSFEIIVCSDLKNSNARQIVENYNDDRIIYVENPFNYGIALSVKGAINSARGKYITILNDDDEFEPAYLETLVPHLEADANLVACFCDHYIMNEFAVIDAARTDENTIFWHRHEIPEGIVADASRLEVNHKIMPVAIGTVFRKDAIDQKKFFPEVYGAYDLWLAYLLVSQKQPIYYCPLRLTRYRVHDTMETTRRSIEKHQNEIFVFTRALQLSLFPGFEAPLYRHLSQTSLSAGRNQLVFDKPRLARAFFSMSYVASPNAKALAGLLLTLLPKIIRIRLGFGA